MKNNSNDLKKRLEEAKTFVLSKVDCRARVGVVLGSGWGSFANELSNSNAIPYSDIPHFTPPSIDGHKGHLVIGRINGVDTAVLQGRIHYYEGHTMDQVVFPIRLLGVLGVRSVILTNASGGINKKMKAGDFMVIKDHLNLTGTNPLLGPNHAFLGPRFPDMTEAYDRKMRKVLKAILTRRKVRFSEGVYGGLSGPTYETPSEVKYLREIGADAVGMSTVPETIAARHMGLKVAGLSCVTNLAAGMTKAVLTHEEVTAVARRVETQFCRFLKDALVEMNKQGLFE